LGWEEKGRGRKGTVPSVEALVEVNGVLAGHHLVLAGAASAALLFRHLRRRRRRLSETNQTGRWRGRGAADAVGGGHGRRVTEGGSGGT